MPEEWPRVGNGLGSTIRDRHSLGQIHSLHITLCLVSEEWPKVRNGPGSKIRNNPSSLVEKNGADIPLLMSILRVDILLDLIEVSEILAQMIIVDIVYSGGRHSFISHRRE